MKQKELNDFLSKILSNDSSAKYRYDPEEIGKVRHISPELQIWLLENHIQDYSVKLTKHLGRITKSEFFNYWYRPMDWTSM